MAVRYLLDGKGYRTVRVDCSEISLAFHLSADADLSK
jgi:hypothetical protein